MLQNGSRFENMVTKILKMALRVKPHLCNTHQ